MAVSAKSSQQYGIDPNLCLNAPSLSTLANLPGSSGPWAGCGLEPVGPFPKVAARSARHLAVQGHVAHRYDDAGELAVVVRIQKARRGSRKNSVISVLPFQPSELRVCGGPGPRLPIKAEGRANASRACISSRDPPENCQGGRRFEDPVSYACDATLGGTGACPSHGTCRAESVILHTQHLGLSMLIPRCRA